MCMGQAITPKKSVIGRFVDKISRKEKKEGLYLYKSGGVIDLMYRDGSGLSQYVCKLKVGRVYPSDVVKEVTTDNGGNITGVRVR